MRFPLPSEQGVPPRRMGGGVNNPEIGKKRVCSPQSKHISGVSGDPGLPLGDSDQSRVQERSPNPAGDDIISAQVVPERGDVIFFLSL